MPECFCGLCGGGNHTTLDHIYHIQKKRMMRIFNPAKAALKEFVEED